MLTRAQIQRLAQRNRVGMQVQERDYVQHLLLALLFARAETLIFKGGTALRLVYGGSRYSEDLELIESKLELYQLSWQPAQLSSAIEQVRGDWDRDLRPLLTQYVAFEDVASSVGRMLS
jgi:predicted nucleotidyltransferase component of viral defense system